MTTDFENIDDISTSEDDDFNDDNDEILDEDLFNNEEDEGMKSKSEIKFKLNNLDIALLLQKINRILSSDEKITVANMIFSGAPACANPQHSQIFINFNYPHRMKSIQTVLDYMILIKGLNYHELSHLLFTDYNQSKMIVFLREKYDSEKKAYDTSKPNSITNQTFNNIKLQEYMQNINLLEDCRIECLFSTLYNRAKYYFTFTATNLILDDLESLTYSQLLSTYLIMYGRKFISNNIKYKDKINRIKSRILKDIQTKDSKDFIEIIKKCEIIVDKFIISPSLYDRLELAYDLTVLLNKANLKLESNTSEESLQKGKSKKGTKKRMEDAINKLKEQMDKLKQKEKDDNENKTPSQKNQEEKNIKSTQKSDNKEEVEDMMQSIMNDIKNDVEKSEQIMQEVNSEIQRLQSGEKEFGSYSGTVLPFEKSMNESKRIENILKKLRGDLSSAVYRFQKKGQIDILSAIKSQKSNSLNIFKKHKLNKVDKSRLGVSFLLDTSGSINSNDFRNEISATWCMTKALEELDNKAQVIEFSTSFRVLKEFDNEGDWKRSYCESTCIKRPLEQSFKDLLILRRKENIQNLFTIIISDGQFSESSTVLKPIFDKFKKEGIKIIWIYASTYSDRARDTELAKEVNWFIPIKNLKELSFKLNNIIRDIQKSINKRILTQDSFFQ